MDSDSADGSERAAPTRGEQLGLSHLEDRLSQIYDFGSTTTVAELPLDDRPFGFELSVEVCESRFLKWVTVKITVTFA